MPSNDVMSEKKKALLAYKEQILQELRYYDKRIDDVRNQGTKNSFYENADSSDSEEEFPLTVETGPSVPELKCEQAMLRTCLQATQELTNLQVLQSEVNVLVDDPQFEGEPPVTEPGVWREVTAECRVDLVPFSITFYVHQPDRKFGPPSYRGLRVAPLKAAHEGELRRSVLPQLATPSDAVEVLKSFSSAQRARRATLARLADKFANTLYMEPMAEGGYVLRCAQLLEVRWALQNRWSPVAPFHHRMKFDLEYMDESYIKSITQAHRRLSDPTIDADERTLLLARIINICLEAQGPTQELYESMCMEPEAAQRLRERRTTLDAEPPAHAHVPPREVMAPPKALPKKAKPKGKENMVDNRKESLKRGNSNEDMNKSKKMRKEFDANENIQDNDVIEDGDDEIIDTRPGKEKTVSSKEEDKQNVASNKSNEAKKANKNNVDSSNKDKKVASAKNAVEKETVVKNAERDKTVKAKSDVANTKNIPKTVDSNKNINKAKPVKESDIDRDNAAVPKSNTKTADPDKNRNKAKTVKEKSSEKIKKITNSQKETKDAKTADVEEKTNVEKGQKKDEAVKENSNEKVKKVNKDFNKGVKEKDGAEKATNSNKDSKGKQEIASVNKLIKKSAGNIEENKNVNPKSDKINKEKPVANTKKLAEKAKGVADTKDKEPVNIKGIAENKTTNTKRNDDINTKTKETVQSKEISDKNIENDKVTVKGTVANSKTKISTEIKDTTTKEEKRNKMQTEIASVKDKIPPSKENKIKKIVRKNDNKEIPDKNIENTIETAVEKRQSIATKRKSNLLDRSDNGNGVTSKNKTTNNSEVANKMTGLNNKNVAIKRKSTVANNNNDKKRALNSVENLEKKDAKPKIDANFQKPTKKVESKLKSKLMPGSIKTFTSGNTNKVLSAGNIGSDKKTSRIPQKKLSAVSEATMKKNPLRISPRKISSKFKSTTDGAKSIQKTTSIPRLLKKPMPKT